jgi:hypothetical protein
MEVIAAVLRSESRKILNFEIAGLFQIVIVGDKVGILLAPGARREQKRK